MGVGAGLYMYDVVVKTLTFASSSTDEFLSLMLMCHRRSLMMKVFILLCIGRQRTRKSTGGGHEVVCRGCCDDVDG